MHGVVCLISVLCVPHLCAVCASSLCSVRLISVFVCLCCVCCLDMKAGVGVGVGALVTKQLPDCDVVWGLLALCVCVCACVRACVRLHSFT